MNTFKILLSFLIALALAGCSSAQTEPANPNAATSSPVTSPSASAHITSIKRITDHGGRLDWYHGPEHELIVFDGLTPGGSDVFTMNPDGSNRLCITCMLELPKGFKGQPAWHPDGEHIIIQAESEHSSHGLFNHMAWGINADLWIIDRAGTMAERVWRSPENHGALHAHFDKSGTKLVFSERRATGVVASRLTRKMGAGGENHWAGWSVHLADVDLSKSGEAILSNHQNVFENRPGFYETHGFRPNGDIVFSYTRNGRPFVDDIYVAAPTDNRWKPLVKSPKTWDEHAQFSPSGQSMAFISSRVNSDWKAPKSRANTLQTELYLHTQSGKTEQLTRFNAVRDRRILVSDFAWDQTGNRIAFQVAPMAKGLLRPPSPEIWVMEFTP